MMIHEITKKTGGHRRRTRVGRGKGSGLGKTAGRGHKGARSRSGFSLNPAYQGGQINFIQKMPKRGFTNAAFKKVYHVVNVKALEAIAGNGDEVTAESLAAAGVIRDANLPLKVLGEGDITKKLKVTAAKFSASAKAKIEAAGGTVVEIVKVTWNRDPEAFAAKAKARAERAANPPAPASAPEAEAPAEKPKKSKAPKS
jgi:large subunit ribosomal protein L15